MTMARNVIAFFLAAALAGAAADVSAASKIYRTVDEDGNVVFTDIPPKDGEQSESVAVESPNTFTGEPARPDQWIVEQGEGAEAEADAFSYESLTINSPADDEAVRENAGNVNIVATAVPALRPGHRIRVLLDGVPEQEGHQSSFVLSNVDRGTHSVTTEIVDEAGTVLLASAPTTFHLQRVAAGRPVPAPTRRAN